MGKPIILLAFAAALLAASQGAFHGGLATPRLRTRQAPTGANHPAAVYQVGQGQEGRPAAATGSLIYYPAHGSNPLVGQQQHFRLQGLQNMQPLAHQLLYQPQQAYQQQQTFQQQQQPELQYQHLQQDPNQQPLVPVPGGGVRYARPQAAVDPPAATPTRGGELGVSYSPASAVSSIKFSNPYANYSYG